MKPKSPEFLYLQGSIKIAVENLVTGPLSEQTIEL